MTRDMDGMIMSKGLKQVGKFPSGNLTGQDRFDRSLFAGALV